MLGKFYTIKLHAQPSVFFFLIATRNSTQHSRGRPNVLKDPTPTTVCLTLHEFKEQCSTMVLSKDSSHITLEFKILHLLTTSHCPLAFLGSHCC